MDDGGGAASIQLLAQRIIVEALIGDHSPHLDSIEQGLCPDAIMALTRQKEKLRQIAQCIHKGDDLGRQTAAGAPNRPTISSPFTAARTKEALWTTIGELLDRFSAEECRNYLSNCGYEFT